MWSPSDFRSRTLIPPPSGTSNLRAHIFPRLFFFGFELVVSYSDKKTRSDSFQQAVCIKVGVLYDRLQLFYVYVGVRMGNHKLDTHPVRSYASLVRQHRLSPITQVSSPSACSLSARVQSILPSLQREGGCQQLNRMHTMIINDDDAQREREKMTGFLSFPQSKKFSASCLVPEAALIRRTTTTTAATVGQPCH
jgi:hypothetical protein